MRRWTRIKYLPNLPLRNREYVTCSEEHRKLARKAAREGIVLMKNETGLLPLKKGAKIAMFGRGSVDYVRGGGGSGEVAVQKETTLYDAFKSRPELLKVYEPLCEFYACDIKAQYEKGAAPGMTREPELNAEQIKNARNFSDTAMIVLSRFSGEGWDRSAIEYYDGVNPWDHETTRIKLAGEFYPGGDFYLTAEEKKMLAAVKKNFSRIIVILNTGSIVDTRWIKEDPQIEAAVNIWQGGMEGADAAAEVICGLVNPSGKLSDTFARTIESYPSTENYHESVHYVDYSEDIYVGYRYFETISGAREEVCYPFGFGLSYTNEGTRRICKNKKTQSR